MTRGLSLRRPAIAAAAAAVLLAMLAVLLASVAMAQQAPSRAQLREAERAKIEAERAVAAAAAQRAAARRELDALEDRLVAAAAIRAQTEAEASSAEARLLALIEQEADATRTLCGDRERLSRLLAALIVMERQNPPALAITPGNASDAARAALLMAGATPTLRARAREAQERIALLREARLGLAEERDRLALAEAELARQGAEIDALQSRAQAAVARLDDAVAQRTRVAARAAGRLDSLQALAARVTRAREAAARPARGQGGRATAARTTPGRLAPLVTPAAGSLVEAFGVQRAPGLRSDTVTWSTRRRAQVVAPAGGEVAFAAPWRNFAQVLIIRVDADYAVVLTGMETLSVREGQSVRAGQPVGAMPDRTSPAPRLALQLRRDGNAIDPGPWLRR